MEVCTARNTVNSLPCILNKELKNIYIEKRRWRDGKQEIDGKGHQIFHSLSNTIAYQANHFTRVSYTIVVSPDRADPIGGHHSAQFLYAWHIYRLRYKYKKFLFYQLEVSSGVNMKHQVNVLYLCRSELYIGSVQSVGKASTKVFV